MEIQIDKEKNEVCINLNKQFYNLDTLKESCDSFTDVCEGSVKESDDKLIVILNVKDKDIIDYIGYEFCNYSLGLMKNKLLV